jgi:hypothetical protein
MELITIICVFGTTLETESVVWLVILKSSPEDEGFNPPSLQTLNIVKPDKEDVVVFDDDPSNQKSGINEEKTQYFNKSDTEAKKIDFDTSLEYVVKDIKNTKDSNNIFTTEISCESFSEESSVDNQEELSPELNKSYNYKDAIK